MAKSEVDFYQQRLRVKNYNIKSHEILGNRGYRTVYEKGDDLVTVEYNNRWVEFITALPQRQFLESLRKPD